MQLWPLCILFACLASQDGLLEADGDTVTLNGSRASSMHASFRVLLEQSQPILNIELTNLESLDGERTHRADRTMSRRELMLEIQQVIRSYELALVSEGTKDERRQLRLVNQYQFSEAVESNSEHLPSVSLSELMGDDSSELMGDDSPWPYRVAEVIRVTIPCGDLEAAALARSTVESPLHSFLLVETTSIPASIELVTTVQQAIRWSQVIRAVRGARDQAPSRRFELQHLTGERARALVETFLSSRKVSRRFEITSVARDTITIRSDVELLDEVEALLSIADRS